MTKLTNFFTRLMNKYLPDPFVFAIGLTLLTVVLAMVVERSSFTDITYYWGSGFWDLLAFTTQMAVILAAGYVLAKTPFVDKILNMIVSKVHQPRTAVAVATLVGGIGSYLNWGFGLIIGGIIATKLARGVKGVHYPLIIAAGYSGFALYGLGLSGSVPVLISTPGHFLEGQIGIIPLSETIFSFPMLITSLLLITTLPIVNALLHPKREEDIIEINPDLGIVNEAAATVEDLKHETIASKLNNSKFFGVSIGLLGMLYIFLYFSRGGSIDLNIINFILLFLGILLLGTPARYIETLNSGIKTISGIILQFPFYAGIMAIIVGTGLVGTIAQGFVSISTPETLPFWGLISAFFINILAPSAGGQWAVQGPIMIEAAQSIGASITQTSMAVMLGDAWNNMVQPFWILPVLALSSLKLKDVMGYTVVIMLWIGAIFVSVFLLWGYFG
ncbi:short-chain fatty acid transporter [Alkalihalobacterium alkalinitrilicum]|uniref:short-chain fatty acid transporter n=1 Tax=Alkalihalobacterium alkalinitrilicum TaxID=427920 RepID=UPI000995496C|nr:TIGR00366 family protein [Alkalihalobacterium alkalinitrilicum]